MARAQRQRQAHEALVVARSAAIGGVIRAAGMTRGSVRASQSSSGSSLAELAEHLLEILGLAEIPVDRGEAHIGDVVEALQPLHDQFADRLATAPRPRPCSRAGARCR